MEFPLVSVGLPTYNRPVGLKKCLEHLLQQTYRNLEIIISDNCSTDPAVQQVITAYAEKDSRVKNIRQPVNIGLENNFNFVLGKASAEYFIWMSDDDYFDDNYIEKCVEFLQLNPGHVICSGIAQYYEGEKLIFTEKMFGVEQKTSFARIARYFSKAEKNGMFYGVFRNKLFPANPLQVKLGCDWAFMAQLAIFGKMAFVTTTGYRRSAEGNSGTKGKMANRFGLNWFQRVFFEVYVASTISRQVFLIPACRKKFSWLARQFIVKMVFGQIMFHLVKKFIRKILGLRKYPLLF